MKTKCKSLTFIYNHLMTTQPVRIDKISGLHTIGLFAELRKPNARDYSKCMSGYEKEQARMEIQGV